MECDELQTLHWHYKACVYITNDVKHCYFFNFLTLEDVELNQRGQQYILVQNYLNKLHFTSLLYNTENCVIGY